MVRFQDSVLDDTGDIKTKGSLLMREKWWGILDRAVEYSLYGLIISIPISNASIESFFGFSFLFFLAKKCLKPDLKFVKFAAFFFLLSFFVFMALSLFNSGPHIVKSIKTLLLKWSEYILILIIAQDTLSNRRRIKNCLIILLSTAFIICIDALYQLSFGTDFLRHKLVIPLNGKSSVYGVTASFHHYNSFGAYLVFNLSLVSASLIYLKNKLIKMSLFVLLILLLVSLLLTFSRGSWVGFLAALIIMLFLSPKKRELVYLFSIYILVMFFLPGITERTMFTFTPKGDSDRFLVWQGAFRMIKQHPFLGMGVGTFMSYFQEYVSKNLLIQYAHNCYLQIWAETGIFSLASFLLFAGSVLCKGIKSFKVGKDFDFILLGFICAFFGTLVHSFFDNHLYSLQLSVLFWLMAGFIMAMTKLNTA